MEGVFVGDYFVYDDVESVCIDGRVDFFIGELFGCYVVWCVDDCVCVG